MSKNFAGQPMAASKQRDGGEKAKGAPPTSGKQSHGGSSKGNIAGNCKKK